MWLGSESSCSSQISFFITSKYMLCYKMMLFEKKNPLPRKKHFKVKKKKNKTHTPHIHTVGSNKQYRHETCTNQSLSSHGATTHHQQEEVLWSSTIQVPSALLTSEFPTQNLPWKQICFLYIPEGRQPRTQRLTSPKSN